jgi:L-threonylcarbamoyladenylate synthase
MSDKRTRAVKTRVLRVDPESPDPRAIGEAVCVFRGGGLVVFPTETVYGLGARALDDEAVARIFSAKGRPFAHPVIAHVAGEPEAMALAAEWTDAASRFARAFWPGPLTLVVPRAAGVPSRIGGGGESIAIRAPGHGVARALLLALGEPIAAPSANRYQALSPTCAAHVLAGLDGVVDLVLDGGASEGGIESTVIDVRGDEVAILRPGGIDRDALSAVHAGVVHETATVAASDTERASPGMDARHYAPRTPLYLAPSRDAALAVARRRADIGERIGVVLLASPDGSPRGARIRVAILPDNSAEYARALYAALHDLDDSLLDAIVVETVPDGESWRAVADRLRRASAR